MAGRQAIPRPAVWSPEPARPWRAELDLGSLIGSAPVLPVGVRAVEPLPGARLSAVLVVLTDAIPERPGPHVLVTRRAGGLRSHAGEVSFPGGRVEPGEQPSTAALREAWEEVALDPRLVAVRGELSHVDMRVSSSYVVPVVATVDVAPELVPHTAEVDAAYWVAISDLVAPGAHHRERWVRGDLDAMIEFFELPDDTIWGATARILAELLVDQAPPAA